MFTTETIRFLKYYFRFHSRLKIFFVGLFLSIRFVLNIIIMDEEEYDTSSFRTNVFDLSIKRSNSSPALSLLVNTTEYKNNFIYAFIFLYTIYDPFIEMICNLILIFVIQKYVDIVLRL